MNDPTPTSLAGQQLAQYRIGDRLGAGGMGEVYRAEDTRLGRTVAVKVLHAGPTCPDERARLFREARAASVLRSSNIATIYDLGEHGDRPFIVMELVAGEALSARLTRGPLPIPEAVSIAAQAADALDEAHGHGIIHRDVKSANLMVDGRGRVKLLDFGLAKYDERPTASSITTGALLETQPGDGDGHVHLHVAGAGAGPRARRAVGPVLARRRALRDAHRPAAVRGRRPRPTSPIASSTAIRRRSRGSTTRSRSASTRSSSRRWPRIRRSATSRRASSTSTCTPSAAGSTIPTPAARAGSRPAPFVAPTGRSRGPRSRRPSR